MFIFNVTFRPEAEDQHTPNQKKKVIMIGGVAEVIRTNRMETNGEPKKKANKVSSIDFDKSACVFIFRLIYRYLNVFSRSLSELIIHLFF